MKNINTPKFWDKDFKDEFTGKTPSRWLPMKFYNLTSTFPSEGSVLIVGCGLGHLDRYIHAWRPYKYETVGTDFSEYAITQSKLAALDILDATFFKADALNQPVKDGSMDVVVAADIIEHLSDVEGFVKELARVTKPGGLIIISTPERLPSGEMHSPEHVQEFSRNSLMNLFRDVCVEHTFTPSTHVYDIETGGVLFDDTIFYTGKRR